jgi:hypothetical protein
MGDFVCNDALNVGRDTERFAHWRIEFWGE